MGREGPEVTHGLPYLPFGFAHIAAASPYTRAAFAVAFAFML